ncbi:hypothetical protein BHE74_00039288, partial [Ensete ventricosum]
VTISPAPFFSGIALSSPHFSPAHLLFLISLTSSLQLSRLSESIRETLSRTPYAPPEGASVSIKSILESLLPSGDREAQEGFRKEVREFFLCCAALASAEGDESPTLFWVTKDLIFASKSALRELSRAASFESEQEMVIGLLPDVLPAVKGVIKESCVDTEEEDVIAASAKAPVAYAIVAAHQFRWLVSQVCLLVAYPDLGKLLWLVIPCALTSLDHWSAEVKALGRSSKRPGEARRGLSASLNPQVTRFKEAWALARAQATGD